MLEPQSPTLTGRRALALLLIVAVLAVTTMLAVRSVQVNSAPTHPVVLQVNWGAVVMRGVTIIGAGIIVAAAPAITVPIVITALGGGAAAFDLTFNRCAYGINIGC